MKKTEFLQQLEDKLTGLPQTDVKRTLEYYSEMLDDSVEDGMNEEKAVEDLGSIEEIVSQTIAEIPVTSIIKEKVTPKHKHKPWMKILLIVLSPIWVVLLTAASVITLAVFAVLWILIPVIWLCTLAFGVIGIGGIFIGIIQIVGEYVPNGVLLTGSGIFSIGLCIVGIICSGTATRGILNLTKKLWIGLKTRISRRGISNEKVN